MAQYQMYFDTMEGEIRYNVDVGDDEIIEDVLRDIMGELSEKGHIIRGESIGDLKVIWGGREGRELDLSGNLPDQGVRPNDVLRILIEIYEGGARSLRADRIEKEWKLLERLVRLNPDRLEILERYPAGDAEVFRVHLKDSPGIETVVNSVFVPRNQHTLQLAYPRFYPEIPIECYVEEPLFHPNVNPDTGFICLWEQSSRQHTVVQAVARAHAMAAYQMLNTIGVHVMNKAALQWYEDTGKPQDLVPLGWSDLKVYEMINGERSWLEPGRSSGHRPRLA